MNPALAFLVLCAATLLLGLLPFLPALLEWRRKTDVAPLRIARERDVDIRHFARGFRTYIQSQLPGGRTTGFTGDRCLEGQLQDGTPFVKSKGDVEPMEARSE